MPMLGGKKPQRQRVLLLAGLGVALAVMVTCGVVVVLLQAREVERAGMSDMQTFASIRALQLAETITQTVKNIGLVIPYVRRNPGPGNGTLSEGVLSQNFPLMLKDWMSIVPDTMVTQVVVSYQAHGVQASQPPWPANLSSMMTAEVAFNPASGPIFNQFMYLLRTGHMQLTLGRALDLSTVAFALRMPIFHNASSAAETWGWPANMSAQACLNGQAPCYNATTGQKWWGYVAFSVGKQGLDQSLSMQRLRLRGYGYTVTLGEDLPGLDDPLARTPTVLATNSPDCKSEKVSSTEAAAGILRVSVELCMVDVAPVPWKIPLLVVAVVVPVLLVALVGLTVRHWPSRQSAGLGTQRRLVGARNSTPVTPL